MFILCNNLIGKDYSHRGMGFFIKKFQSDNVVVSLTWKSFDPEMRPD